MGCSASSIDNKVVPTQVVSSYSHDRKFSGLSESNSRMRFPSLSNYDTLPTLTTEPSLPRNKSETQEIATYDLEPPSILYSVDLAASKIMTYNIDTKKRLVNDLSKAALLSTNPRYIPLNPMKEEVFDHIFGAPSILASEKYLHFIGEKHFAYEIKQNLFSYRSARTYTEVKNSSLCKLRDEIFAISGEEGDGYSVKCEKYNITQNVWTQIASLPKPYFKGSTCGFIDSDGAAKIIIAGGLSAKDSSSPNQAIAIYDVASDTWTESKFTWKLTFSIDPQVPSLPLINCKINKFCLASLREDKIQMNFIDLKTGKSNSKTKPYPRETLEHPSIESSCISDGSLCLVISEKDGPIPLDNELPCKQKPSIMFDVSL